jgi:hypothetical protein
LHCIAPAAFASDASGCERRERTSVPRALLVLALLACLPARAQDATPTPTPGPKVVLEPLEDQDRWRIDWPLDQRYREADVRGNPLNPYRQNTLKGDRPVFGQNTFFVLTIQADSIGIGRRVNLPSGVSAEDPDRLPFFGQGELLQSLENVLVSFELFHGETAFRPRDWALKISPAFNANLLAAQERSIVNVNPARGITRTRFDVALQEAFGEVKLFDVGPYYDFVSVRAGIQPFVSDFRGLIFRDTNLGFRLFGNARSNRWQYNLAVFDQLEKETNSELNEFARREQQVLVANLYRQDFLALGYTAQLNVVLNRDEASLHYDKNDFLVRPANVGTVVPHEIRAAYFGWTGDGHIGRLNLSHAAYLVLGEDDRNPIAGRAIDINAQLGFLELSIDKDWLRPRLTLLFASGDEDPTDDIGRGFDSVFEGPPGSLLAGGFFSFWQRQQIPLTQTNVALTNPGSFLPNLRPTNTEGQANYVNPGLLLGNIGLDLELTPKLRTLLNATYLGFHRTEPIELLIFQPNISPHIGIDLSVGWQWRPLLSENVQVNVGFASLVPLEGFKQIFTSKLLFAPSLELKLLY